MTHTFFVVAAYSISAVVLAALIAWIVIENYARRRQLGELDRSGIRRRSDRAGERTS